VITSSLAAVADCFNPAHTYSEADWNEDSSLTRNPYYYSKTLAERAAHEFVATQSVGFDVVSINPGIVLGCVYCNVLIEVTHCLIWYSPHLSGGVNESVALLQRYELQDPQVTIVYLKYDTLRYLSGDRSLVGIIDLSWLVVDVRDVAEAHVRAIQVKVYHVHTVNCSKSTLSHARAGAHRVWTIHYVLWAGASGRDTRRSA
jgi:dihydroflavonol-4-reductase